MFANLELAIKSAIMILQLRERFDVLHVQHTHLQSAVACFVGRVLGKPSVLTLHGQVPEPSEPMRGLAYRSAERWALALSFVRVAVSTFVAQAYGSRKIAIETVWNGVDTELFKPSTQGRFEMRRKLGLTNEVVFIYAGRWTRTKGLDLLLRGIESLPANARPFVLLILGEPSPDEPQFLEEALMEQEALSRVKIVGSADGLLHAYLAAADVFVLPSLYEGMPLGLLEAMSSGVPCLVSDIPVNAAIISEARCGWVFRSGDLADLNRAISEILINGIPVQLSQNARGAAIRYYDLGKVAATYSTLYRRLASRATTKPSIR